MEAPIYIVLVRGCGVAVAVQDVECRCRIQRLVIV